MIKKVFIFLLMSFVVVAQAQPKKKPKTKTVVDSAGNSVEVQEKLSPMDSLEAILPREVVMDANGKKVFYKDVKRRNDSLRKVVVENIRKPRRTFWVRTKYPAKGSKERVQLCLNLVSKDTNITYCMNDSVCKDPEDYKILFQKQTGDTNYVMLYIDAYSKSSYDQGMCGAGHETKLVFARWNVKTNQAKWKTKNIRSCLKGITLLGQDPFTNWDKKSPLVVKYHRADFFYEVMIDPNKPELGIQPLKDEGKKEEGKSE